MRCGSISPKTILILPKNFLKFRFNAVEQQSIVNLSHYGSKGYALVVLGNSKVTFLKEKKDVALFPFVYCVLVIYDVAVLEQYVIEFPYFPYFWGYFIKTSSFRVFYIDRNITMTLTQTLSFLARVKIECNLLRLTLWPQCLKNQLHNSITNKNYLNVKI